MKKRAPIEQLKKAGEEATKKLIDKGILSKDNLVERLMKEQPDLILPGIPSYVPHHTTIMYSRRMMFDLLQMWKTAMMKDKVNNLALFIEFAITELNYHEDIAKRKMVMMEFQINLSEEEKTLGEVFKPVNEYETVKAMKKFFVDAFAVCVVVRGKTANTSDFIHWFLSWSEQLDKLWDKNEQKRKTKKTVVGA